MQIYKLEPILDDPRFEGFGWELEGLTNEHGRTYDFKIPSLRRKWDYPEFTFQDNVNPFNDFPCCLHVPIFSRRAVSVLKDYLEANGELLSVRSKFGDYFAYQTRTLANGILNRAKTKGILLDDSKTNFFDIQKYAFFKSKIKSLTIFRIPEHPSTEFVTEKFVERVQANRLLGFHFDAVWTSESGKRPRSVIAKSKPSEKNLKQTLVIHLRISGSEPTKRERTAADRVREKIANALVLDDPDDEYLGGLAGAEIADGWLRLLLPCQNATKLHAFLQETLSRIDFKGETRVSIRMAPYWDDEADDRFVA